ncbi:MAG: anti-sigma factor family protein [Fidelibacterota bacterium]
MKPCKEFENRIPLYVSGDLTEAERRRVTDHLQDCPACRDYHSALAAIITSMKRQPVSEPPVSYGAELVVALNRRLENRKKRQQRLLWGIPAFVSTAVLLIFVATTLFRSDSNRWFEQFNQEHVYVNFSSVGYLGEFLLEAPDDAIAESQLSTDEIYRNVLYRLVEEEPLCPEFDRCLVATATLDDAEFRQVVRQMKQEIL